jgi:hypothetical protein
VKLFRPITSVRRSRRTFRSGLSLAGLAFGKPFLIGQKAGKIGHQRMSQAVTYQHPIGPTTEIISDQIPSLTHSIADMARTPNYCAAVTAKKGKERLSHLVPRRHWYSEDTQLFSAGQALFRRFPFASSPALQSSGCTNCLRVIAGYDDAGLAFDDCRRRDFRYW